MMNEVEIPVVVTLNKLGWSGNMYYVIHTRFSIISQTVFTRLIMQKNIPPFISSNLSPFMTRNVGFQDEPLNYMLDDYYVNKQM